ncbi:CbtB domain-containing protein [Haloarcula sp. NS06]|uniref:CbtB domain-containing protein n=1 Tax=unclassified Haloarcula TaxID=2624677 RepID=UPI00073F2744|nr:MULTISPECIES: CbtB domain-containing protein [unclassified Haloarcula]MDQ2070945.1 CbtB domain-containing protein [Haloarcula sp. H-GB4]
MQDDTDTKHATDSVYDRIERAKASLTGPQIAIAVALVAALGFTLLFVQDPMLHDSLHNFRHSAGITCH